MSEKEKEKNIFILNCLLEKHAGEKKDVKDILNIVDNCNKQYKELKKGIDEIIKKDDLNEKKAPLEHEI